ncbi:hypothetical protein [Piscirickettsia salmonis]|uniref:hypothetical protein n=1 Tax=Piscirickettsia salmonis TaxID=1238 RepID=UPI0012BA645D|nr:hypothetical protein [Piscirickettsia salmonis]
MCKIPTEVATLTHIHECNKFAQNSIYLSSQQATRYFGKLPLRVVMRFVFFRSKLRGIRPLAIDNRLCLFVRHFPYTTHFIRLIDQC